MHKGPERGLCAARSYTARVKQAYIFAYGSLMNPRSLAKTLPGERAVLRASVQGFRRKMSVPFGGYAYLNLVPEAGRVVEGILIPVTEAEFELFSSREEGYDRVDVTPALKDPIDGVAYAFIAPDSDASLKVPRSYIETCTVGMTPEQKALWINETIMGEVEEDLENPVYEFHA